MSCSFFISNPINFCLLMGGFSIALVIFRSTISRSAWIYEIFLLLFLGGLIIIYSTMSATLPNTPSLYRKWKKLLIPRLILLLLFPNQIISITESVVWSKELNFNGTFVFIRARLLSAYLGVSVVCLAQEFLSARSYDG